jgi:hypothetical protein
MARHSITVSDYTTGVAELDRRVAEGMTDVRLVACAGYTVEWDEPTDETQLVKNQLAAEFRTTPERVFKITSCDYDVVLGRTVYNVIRTHMGQWVVEDSYPVDPTGPYAQL